jgi:hypothetical protein
MIIAAGDGFCKPNPEKNRKKLARGPQNAAESPTKGIIWGGATQQNIYFVG